MRAIGDVDLVRWIGEVCNCMCEFLYMYEYEFKHFFWYILYWKSRIISWFYVCNYENCKNVLKYL